MSCDAGVWREIIKVLGVVGVVVNVAILTYTMDWFNEHYDVSNEDTLWYFIYTVSGHQRVSNPLNMPRLLVTVM